MALLKRNRRAPKSGGRRKKYLKIHDLIEARYGSCSGEIKMARIPREIPPDEISQAIEFWLLFGTETNDYVLRDELVGFIEKWRANIHPTSPRWEFARTLLSDLEDFIGLE